MAVPGGHYCLQHRRPNESRGILLAFGAGNPHTLSENVSKLTGLRAAIEFENILRAEPELTRFFRFEFTFNVTTTREDILNNDIDESRFGAVFQQVIL